MDVARGQRIAVIDALRGVAIGLVVWYHIWQISWQPAIIPFTGISLQAFAESGFLGVALFFFISGFVLMLPYVEAPLLGRPAPTLQHFFTRRFLKIVPSYVFCIIVLLALGYQHYSTVTAAIKDVAFHLFFIHGWFSATNGTINGVMWSLAAEVQFYLVFPLILIAFTWRPIATSIVLFVIANAWRLWCLFSNHYFFELRLQQLPAQLDFFAAGMLSAYAYAVISSRLSILPKHRWAAFALMSAGIVGFVLVVNDCYVHRQATEWPFVWEVQWRSVCALLFAAISLGMLFTFRAVQSAVANRILIFYAMISYNLYLWHQPVARALLKFHVPNFVAKDPHNDSRWQIAFSLVAIIATTIVGWLVTIGVERPFLRIDRTIRSYRPSIAALVREKLRLR